jgi:hypothetical protein
MNRQQKGKKQQEILPETREALMVECIDHIGMGHYQWKLFFLCGLGWLCDNMYLQSVSAVLIPFKNEFHLSGFIVATMSSFLVVGMFIGALFWGVVSDNMYCNLLKNF